MPAVPAVLSAAALSVALAVPAVAAAPVPAPALSDHLLTAAAMPKTGPYDGPWDRTAGGTGVAAPAGRCLEPKMSAAGKVAFRRFAGRKGAGAVEHVVQVKNVAAAEKLADGLLRRLVGPRRDSGTCYWAWTADAGRKYKGVAVQFHNVVDVRDALTVVVAVGKVPGEPRPLTRAWAIGRDGSRVAVLEIDHRRPSTHEETLRAVLPVAKSMVGKLGT